MMAVHELGHVIGALITGGVVERVVLHPFTISRTDVSPNPNPAVVVWLGPVFGCAIPLVVGYLIPKRFALWRKALLFFAGFCLLSNGAYIAFGAIDRIGDCGVMLQNGSPLWALLLFGSVAAAIGLLEWHRLGSAKTFLKDPSLVDSTSAYVLFGALVLMVFIEQLISPM